MRGRSVGRAVLVAVAAAVLALAPALGASAHDYLVDSSPKAGSVQTTPIDHVTLTFNDHILDLSGKGSSALMQVTGPDASRQHFETKCPTILDRTLTAPVALGGPGKYTVTWQVVSADGHTVSESIVFTYKPAAGTPASAGTANGPGCGQGVSTASAAAPATTAAPSNDLGIVIGIAIAIVVLALIGVAIVVVSSRTK